MNHIFACLVKSIEKVTNIKYWEWISEKQKCWKGRLRLKLVNFYSDKETDKQEGRKSLEKKKMCKDNKKKNKETKM